MPFLALVSHNKQLSRTALMVLDKTAKVAVTSAVNVGYCDRLRVASTVARPRSYRRYVATRSRWACSTNGNCCGSVIWWIWAVNSDENNNNGGCWGGGEVDCCAEEGRALQSLSFLDSSFSFSLSLLSAIVVVVVVVVVVAGANKSIT